MKASGSNPSVAVVLSGNMARWPPSLSGRNGVSARGERSRKDQRGGSEPAQQAAAFKRLTLIVVRDAWSPGHAKASFQDCRRSTWAIKAELPMFLLANPAHCSSQRVGGDPPCDNTERKHEHCPKPTSLGPSSAVWSVRLQFCRRPLRSIRWRSRTWSSISFRHPLRRSRLLQANPLRNKQPLRNRIAVPWKQRQSASYQCQSNEEACYQQKRNDYFQIGVVARGCIFPLRGDTHQAQEPQQSMPFHVPPSEFRLPPLPRHLKLAAPDPGVCLLRLGGRGSDRFASTVLVGHRPTMTSHPVCDAYASQVATR